jgi:hypothetical protein
MYGLRRKGTSGSITELSPVLKKFSKNPMLNGIKGVETSRQDPTQPSFQLVKQT